MNRHYGELIGSTIGKVLDVEVDTDVTSWGPYLRVQVYINLSKPLTRGRSLKVGEDNIWISIKYKNYPISARTVGGSCTLRFVNLQNT